MQTSAISPIEAPVSVMEPVEVQVAGDSNDDDDESLTTEATLIGIIPGVATREVLVGSRLVFRPSTLDRQRHVRSRFPRDASSQIPQLNQGEKAESRCGWLCRLFTGRARQYHAASIPARISPLE